MMGNAMSGRPRRENQVPRYLDDPRLPLEIKLIIAAELCPYCSIEEDAIPATENARELQRALANLGATCKHLGEVADQHRFHSFVMPYDPDFDVRHLLPESLDEEIVLAQRFKNDALPALLDRMITDGQIGEHLRYLSIRDFTLQFKPGVSKSKLSRFMARSLSLGIPIPHFIPGLLNLPHRTRETLSPADAYYWLDEQLWIMWDPFADPEPLIFDEWMVKLLLFGPLPRIQKLMMDPKIAKRVFSSQNPPAATLPSVTTLGIPEFKGEFPRLFRSDYQAVQMEDLLRSFPNLRAFQNNEAAFSWHPYPRTPANSPPFFPNLRRLVLAAEQPDRLHHLTQVLGEFPQLEELYFHRRRGADIGEPDPTFSNADVFNSVHRCLGRLTYSSAIITHSMDDPTYSDDHWIQIDCYEEEKFSDVPRFDAFEVLEDLTIDQALLGRLSTAHDRVKSPTGPYFPDLDYMLPQSLRRLTIQFVYDFPQLSSQLTALASAKQRGQFPLLRDIFVVIVWHCRVLYRGSWPPEIPPLPSADVIRDSGVLLKASGINFWTSTTKLEPPPGDSEDYPHDVVPENTFITIDIRRRFFNDT